MRFCQMSKSMHPSYLVKGPGGEEEYYIYNNWDYKNNRLMATGDDMYILGKGFSLSTVDGHYKVVVSGTVYFRMVGDDDTPVVVSVPVELVGELDVTNDSCIYTCYVK